MNHPAAVPLALLGRVEDALFKEATERLIEKLLTGGKVGRCDLNDLYDCELNDIKRSDIVNSKFAALMNSEYPDTPLLQEKWKLDMIQRYLDSHPDLVHDEMNAMEESNAD